VSSTTARRSGRASRQRAFDVVGVGTNTLDHVCVAARSPVGDGKAELCAYQTMPGGQVPTALVALQRWGLRTAYAGAFGDDTGGALQRASLAEAGVDLSRCRVCRGVASATSVIIVDAVTGARSVLWHRPRALVLGRAGLDRPLFTATAAVLLDADDVEAALRAATWARAAGALVMLDADEPGPHTAELLARTDVVIVPDGFARHAAGCADLDTALRRLVTRGPRLAVATLGAGGAMACQRGSLRHMPAFRVPVVDTTSAGDCFHAGCLYGLLKRWPLARILRFASAAAALACTTLGGRASVPDLGAIEALLGTRGERSSGY
jgi:sugar/nucleoside kinase (ribokinase family)